MLKKRVFLKGFNLKKKRFYHEKKGFFLCQQFQNLELEKVFAEEKFFHHNFRFKIWQIPALQASLNFSQLKGALLGLRLISLHTQDGVQFSPQTEGTHSQPERPAQLDRVDLDKNKQTTKTNKN